MNIGSIRLSQQAKDHLIKLKRKTGIKNWNVLCRWALCTSLSEPSEPPDANIPADSSVEMTWRVFGGEYRDVYYALIKHRCYRAGLGTDEETIVNQIRLHLHRGVGYLFADRSIERIDGLTSKLLT
ncbi:MAG: DNA sulfur modification protein DndE [Myxococcota bacterium]